MSGEPKYKILADSLKCGGTVVTAGVHPRETIMGVKYMRLDLNDLDEEAKKLDLEDCLCRMREDIEAGRPCPASFIELSVEGLKEDAKKIKKSGWKRITDMMRRGM